MLKGIAPCISPDLLKVLAEMGHGDEIVLADAHFPGHSVNGRVLRADGLSVTTLLDGILPLFALDTHAEPLAMMQAVPGDRLDPAVEQQYMDVIRRHAPGYPIVFPGVSEIRVVRVEIVQVQEPRRPPVSILGSVQPGQCPAVHGRL